MTTDTRFRRSADRAPRRVVAAHLADGKWRLVFHDADAPDAPDAARPIGHPAAAAEFEGADLAGVRAFISRHKPDTVVRVVPASSSVCRAAPAPQMPEGPTTAEVSAALSLLAEGEMPSTVPAHRRAAGLLVAPGGGGQGAAGGRRSLLVVGWTEGGGASPLSDVPERWTTEVAALAPLCRRVDGVPAWGVWASPRDGSLSLLALGPTRSVARSLRPDASAGWSEAVGSIVAESLEAAGFGDSRPDVGDTGLSVHPAPVGGDAAFMARFGVAAGAALLVTDAEPAVRSLASMHATAPGAEGGALERSARWLGRPAHAAAVIAVAAAVALLSPLAAAWARASILAARAGGIAELEERLIRARREVVAYDMLAHQAWPMTKLLADVAGAAPVGVTVDALDISSGQGMTIRGNADSVDLVTNFRENLSATGVFSDVGTPTRTVGEAGVAFQLEAEVARPLFPARPKEDFAQTPLAIRLYGDAARAPGYDPARIAAASGGDDSGDGDPGRGFRRSAEPRSESGDSARSSEPRSRPAPAASDPVPPPITEAEINALDTTAARNEFLARTRASTRTDLDQATRDRLKREAELAKARMMAPSRGGGGR